MTRTGAMAANLIDFGKQALAAQPFSSLVGAELLEFTPSTAVLRVAVRSDLKQQHGFVHGGVICYLADNALTYAGGGSSSAARV